MYEAENLRAVLAAARSRSRAAALPAVSRTVLLLGLTILFTDISSEMVATILPLYLVFSVGFTPLQFGVLLIAALCVAVVLLRRTPRYALA